MTKTVADTLAERLAPALDSIGPVEVSLATHEKMLDLMADAEAKGACFRRNGLASANRASNDALAVRPTLITQATPEMRIAQADIFAPVLSIHTVLCAEEALAANSRCPYALTAAVFGPRKAAEALASRIPAGTVLVNDIIVSTADPRAPFGGRKRSGFGATRGREGLLEMTAVKTIQTQTATDLRAYAPHTPHHESFFVGYLRAAHSGGWRARVAGLREFLKAMKNIR